MQMSPKRGHTVPSLHKLCFGFTVLFGVSLFLVTFELYAVEVGEDRTRALSVQASGLTPTV